MFDANKLCVSRYQEMEWNGDGDILDEAKIKQLSKLPSKDELISKMMSSMNSPIYGLVSVMQGPIRGLTTVLSRYVDNNKQGE